MADELCSFDEQLKRLKKISGAETDTALTTLLGVKASGVYNAKKRGRIPHKWFVMISTRYSASLEWLVSGAGKHDIAQPVNYGHCTQCAELQRQLIMANERLYEAMKENGELKAEIGKLREELATLKSKPPQDTEEQAPIAAAQ